MIETVETAVVIPTNPEDHKKIKAILEHVASIKDNIFLKNLEIKENIAVLVEEYKIPKKLATRMVKVFYAESFKKDAAVQDVFEMLYETVTGEKPE